MAALLVLGVSRPLVVRHGPIALVLVVLLLWLTARLVGRLARRMEERADEVAHGEQHDDGVYARALETIYEANRVPAVLARKRRPHPDLYDRMEAAGVVPGYPRPAAPSRPRTLLALLLPLTLVLVTVLGARISVFFDLDRETEQAQLRRMAFTGADVPALEQLALIRQQHGDLSGAAVLLEAVTAAHPDHYEHAATLAESYVQLGRCEDARRALGSAEAAWHAEDGLAGPPEELVSTRASVWECAPHAN
jgi:hypothetical protein